ncbi:MAG: hypothetical protein GF307_07110 [candidate division Zixibacteria bacterium]|nr:hypothetical protein [candidate division Zixibacteria bacterium]
MEKRKWTFNGFTLTVEKVGEPGKYVVEFDGGIDYNPDGSPELRGERKEVEADLDFIFTPKRAMSNTDNRFELNFFLESKVEKFENWLEKTIKNYRAVPEDIT